MDFTVTLPSWPRSPFLLQADSLGLTLDTDRSELTLWRARHDQRLLVAPLSTPLFSPAVSERESDFQFQGVTQESSGILLSYEDLALGRLDVRLAVDGDDCLLVSSRFLPRIDCELSRLVLFPEKTFLNLYDLVNFRNRHHTPHTWPELNLGGKGCETSTYSSDWQFAPHPTQFIFRKGDASLFVGALDLPCAFGMELKAENHRVSHWFLNYGGSGAGLALKAGEAWESPRYALFVDEGASVYETLDRYTAALVRQGLIPDPVLKTRHAWHTENLYCTWIDQVYRAGAKRTAALDEQGAMAASSVNVMDEALVREALDVIERERLPFRTILLDDGWQVARGQWEPHPDRFPDLRRLVDEIHARGMKAIVWWNWAEIFEGAQADPRHLFGGGTLNRHGARVRDYSRSATQTEYLEPLFHKLFSSEPGCYDLDGVKTDFLADKVHADMPVHDPAWRGEENYFLQLTRLFYSLMRRFKPDACHIGCAGHPFLAEFIDVNRTYDVDSSDVREHLNRALMLKHITPGCPVAFDFHNCVENFDLYFETAARHGFSVQIGNILGMRRDRSAPWEPADDALQQTLREGLALFPLSPKQPRPAFPAQAPNDP